MVIWDIGTYRNVAEQNGEPISMDRALRSGRVRIWLEGKKLRGGYALTRLGKGPASRWLLVKRDDDEANARVDILRAAPESVLSGLTIEQMAADT